ncbi:tRNA lysidine(34) synthetase TilS [Corynebacterium incognita]|uniref:tRNA(Ile)-lysidine synthase n=1 Tax=Corynebacterium incognita TaxID=2754725 RepID=A0A7G7CRF7_9CORY|nr:tRNA lysidine(34) synthetase TilS [Corynebacterium incognita]QNE90173.1 tRNA lysidine(34) synthetase TilS [Corynebacterium incognita]
MEPFWPRVSPHFLACRRPVAVALRERRGAVAVGLSGGADSLALVAALAAELRGKDSSFLTVVCVNHQLQPGSRVVAERAATHARAWGLQATVVDVDVDKHPGESLEAAARRVRYAALAEHGDETWVAHTAEDQAETLLLGLLRGHATAMLPRSGSVVRPLLQVRREDTAGACAELGVEPWQDPHNDREDFRRVALRKDIIPRLGEIIGGDAVAPLAQAADAVAEDNAELEPETLTANCAELAALPAPRRRRAIRALLHAHDAPVTKEALREIEALCTHWRGQGAVTIGRRLEVVRVGGTLSVQNVS